uniref:Uncharacterized protein n=1 Tax=Oryza brachyantha TaxID=4533 RepID=J3M7H1_ORYBR
MGNGSMVGSGETKEGPANFSHAVAWVVVMAVFPVCIRGFLWMSQRSEDDARLEDDRAGLLLHPLRLLLGLEEEEGEEEDDDALLLLGLVVLLLSQRSHASARQMLLPRWAVRRSVGGGGDAVAPPAPVLCVSHLSAASARPGLGAGKMMRHGAGSRGNILLLGGVGSRAGRAAAATNCSESAISWAGDDRASETPRTHFSPRTLGGEQARRAAKVNDDRTNCWTAQECGAAYLSPHGQANRRLRFGVRAFLAPMGNGVLRVGLSRREVEKLDSDYVERNSKIE